MPIAQLLDGKRIDLIQNDVELANPDPGLTAMRLASDGGLWARAHGAAEVAVGGGSAAGAAIGFDTLSNVLVVDPSFDSSTVGWGVTAFASITVAANTIPNSGLVFVNGDHTLSANWEIGSRTWVGLSGSIMSGTNLIIISAGETGTIRQLAVSSNTSQPSSVIVVGGDLALEHVTIVGIGASTDGIAVESTGHLSLVNCSLTSNGSAAVLLNNGGTCEAVDCAFFGTYSIGASAQLDDFPVFNSAINAPLVNVAISPLNYSNTLNGITYREVVAVADLPAASLTNQGATAMTSDGGTASAPAMMVNLDGANWTVAYE